MSGDQQRRETAGVTTRLIVALVRDQLGTEAVTELLNRAGETRPVEVVEDERTWPTYTQKIALFDAAAELAGDPRVGFRIGCYVLDAQLGRAQRLVIGALGSPHGSWWCRCAAATSCSGCSPRAYPGTWSSSSKRCSVWPPRPPWRSRAGGS